MHGAKLLSGRILSFVRRTRAGRRLLPVALTGLLVLGASTYAAAQPAQKRVLVLQSFERGNLVIDNFTPNFHVELDQRAGQPVKFVQVVVTQSGSVGAPEQAVVDFIGSIFADGGKPDLIVAIAVARRRSSRASTDSSSFLTRTSFSLPPSTSGIWAAHRLERTRSPFRPSSVL